MFDLSTYKILDNENSLDDFLNIVSEEKEKLSTGFTNLDKLLGGGLTTGLYVIGAEPGIGKTAFIGQIAENLAKDGNNVLFISLEMFRYELQARGVSRQSYLLNIENEDITPYTADEITHFCLDKKGNARKLKVDDYKEAYEKYKEETGKHLFIVENVEGGLTAGNIFGIVQKMVEELEKPPVVFIDYLQLITEKSESDRKSKIDSILKELKFLINEFKIPVVCISSVNRQTYNTDFKQITMSSLKESGDIEFGANVVIGMNCKQVQRGKDIRQIDVDILKNKMGAGNKRITFAYTAPFNHFDEIGNIEAIKPDTKKASGKGNGRYSEA